MKIIVPLAGPDFELTGGGVKAEIPVEGQPLLRRALETRPWWTSGAASDRDLVFILRRSDTTLRFADTVLRAWYPRARVSLISDYTGGAALSALAGLALVADAEEPIIIDLADILYDATIDLADWFGQSRDAGAVALTFASDNPVYSYLRFDDSGVFLEAAEKRVISNNASAGTYAFRSPALLLRAVTHSLEHRAALTYKGLFFVCPLFNGVRAAGERVSMIGVSNVRDLKIPAALQ